LPRSTNRLALLVLLAFRPVAAEPDGPGLYLHVIPGENLAGSMVDPGAPAWVEMEFRDADRSQKLLGDAAVARHADTLTVRAPLSGTMGGEVLPAHRAATFVIDFDEPPVQRLLGELVDRYGDDPSPAEVETFVYEAIVNKNAGRPFDFASRVAANAEGDCTEHAVLLAALLRATGRPARVILGLLLIEDGTEFFTFGHAWTEVHDGDTWRVLDATLPARELPEAVIRHLPMSAFDKEGPGYGMQLVEFASAVPRRVSLVPAFLPD